jgi:hypothetical protein
MLKCKGQVALFFIFVVIIMIVISLFFIHVWNYVKIKKIEAKIELFIQTTDKGRNLSVLLGTRDIKPFMEMLGNSFAKEVPKEEIDRIKQIVEKTNYGLVVWSPEKYGEMGGFYEIFGKATTEMEIDPNVKLEWPAPSANLSSPFGYRMLEGKRDLHGGIDFALDIGTPVYAAADGVIVHVFTDCPNVKINCITASEIERQNAGCECNSGLGNYVVIEHTFGTKTYYTFYAHLSKVNVKLDQKVTSGQKIAESGNSGYSTGPHLHFELADYVRPDFIKSDVYAKNPCFYLPQAPQKCSSEEGYIVAKFGTEIPIPGAQKGKFKTMVGLA